MTCDRMRGRAAALTGVGLGVLVPLCALAVLLLLPAAPATAHTALAGSTPAAEAVLQVAPSAVVLEFTEPVRLVQDRIRVIGPDGRRADTGEPTAADRVVTVPMRSDVPRGTYLVSYRVISADSHPVSGGFAYSVGAPSATGAATGAATLVDAEDPVLAWAIPSAKYLGYAGLALLVGPALVLTALWPRRLPRRAPATLAWTGVGLITVSTVAGLLLQVPYTTGSAWYDVAGTGLREVLGSSFGAAYAIRLLAVLAAGLLLVPLLRGDSRSVERRVLTAVGVVGVGTWPFSGHAVGSPVPALSVVVDAVHLAGMAVWLGGLVMLVSFLLRRANESELDAILPVWSRWAALAVSALLAAGVIQALIETGTPGALLDTAYGQLVLAKMGLVVAVLGAAGYARRLVHSRRAATWPGGLRRAVLAEVGVAAVVLAVTTVLVQTTPARTATPGAAAGAPPASDVAQPFSTTLESPLYSLRVNVQPARIGRNDLRLYASAPGGGQPLTVLEWRADLSSTGAGVEPVAVPLSPRTGDQAIGQFTVPTAGAWRLGVTLRVSDIDQATVSVTVPIK